jgi:hypothetical protein
MVERIRVRVPIDEPNKGRSLRGLNLVGDELSFFPLGPAASDAQVVLSDSTFTSCRIMQSSPRVYSGVQIDNVVFDDLNLCDDLIISSSTFVSRLTFRGRINGGSLWIKPDERALVLPEGLHRSLPDSRTVDWLLDITDLDSPEVTVIGLDTEKIRINPDRHIVVDATSPDLPAWSDVSKRVTSFLWMSRRYLRGFDSPSGIFSIPSLDDDERKQFEEEVAELSASTGKECQQSEKAQVQNRIATRA